MTQLISVITREYALLAADRRLTYGAGPRLGEVFDDDTCKLVSLCGVCGIAYSGLAHIDGRPTHEWIAHVLAEANCRDPATVVRVLSEQATLALRKVSAKLRRQIFLMSGWAQFDKPPGFRSHFCVLSNALDESGSALAEPRDHFTQNLRALRDEEEFLWGSFGQPLCHERAAVLERNLRRLISREIGPREALRLLVDEVVHTSTTEKVGSVGSKVLGYCIPKQAAESAVKTGNFMLLAQHPNETTASFAYFDPLYDELRQFGPTVVCGENAVTDIATENDPSRDYQSSSVRILHLPKKRT